jgi:hypothetical protein
MRADRGADYAELAGRGDLAAAGQMLRWRARMDPKAVPALPELIFLD